MFVTEFHRGIFIAKGTDGCMFHEKVKFDRNFWLPILEKLENISVTDTSCKNLHTQGYSLDWIE